MANEGLALSENALLKEHLKIGLKSLCHTKNYLFLLHGAVKNVEYRLLTFIM
jgi:hypothetical protein